MKKVLFIATVVKTHINAFHLPYLEWFHNHGYEVHVSAKNDFLPKSLCNIPNCDKFFDVNFNRNPLHKDNYKAFRALKKQIEENRYDIIHCHTPVGGVLGRLSAKSQKNTKVMYTAHGYHFYKNGPILSWLLFFPVEKILSRYTDYLILINKEDFNIAKKFNMGKKIDYIPGVGIETSKFKRSSDYKINLMDEKKFNMIYTGELTKEKNQVLLLDVIKELSKTNPEVMLHLVGDGIEKEFLKNKISDMNIESFVKIWGYRNDVPKLISESKIVLSSSLREGLPVNIMEGMAAGKPIIATNSRGNRDLIKHNQNGFLVNNSSYEFVEHIKELIDDSYMLEKFSRSSELLSENYSLEIILPQYTLLYKD